VIEVRDEIWEVVEPMIPPVKVPERQGRRPRLPRAPPP
jgi:transposase